MGYRHCDVIFVDCSCTCKFAQRRSSLVNNNHEYRFLTTRYSRLSVKEGAHYLILITEYLWEQLYLRQSKDINTTFIAHCPFQRKSIDTMELPPSLCSFICLSVHHFVGSSLQPSYSLPASKIKNCPAISHQINFIGVGLASTHATS